MEVAFSRERQELPAPVGLDDFHLKTHIGGYTGETNSIRDWTSEIVFQQPDGSWSDTAPVSVNAPAEKKGLWFFQSSWDKPAPSSGSNGLNYTGLGVGNRNGVFIQLLGCIIAVLGMIFGFYIKPMLMPAAAKKAAVKSDDKSAEVSSEAAPAEGGMSPMKFAAGVVIIIAAFGSLIAYRMYDPTRANAPEPTEFERTIDLEPLDQVAVHASGRLRSFPSHAQTYVRYITGPRRVMGQSSAFTYLDMMFRPDSYLHVPTIYVKSKNVRRNIVQTVNEFEGMAELLPENFMKEGLLPPILLGAPPVEKLLERLGSDLIRTAKHVNAIETAKTVLDPTFLTQRLRLIPPPKNDLEQQWHHVQELLPEVHHSHGANAESVNTGFAQQDLGIADIPDDVEEELAHLWSDLRTAWVEQDAEAANVALAAFAKVLPEISPEAYPSQQRLKLESWYFGQRNMTWVWLVYMLSTVFLLMSIVYGWNWARHTGMGIFALAFLLHTISLGLRWYVSGRWPNSNMFEAVTTAAWFGGCVAILLEWICRNNPMRNLFALGSAGASMTALMAAHFLPVQLNPTIGNMMPVLYDLWLYIHTNVIILSYCLIAMAAITGALYLAWRAAGGSADYARVGGAGSLMSGRLSGKNASLGAVFDGATMILMEISFVLLWAGIVMGAIWADHSWGRPWGWDPKEVFALNTFLVFLVLIHIRFIVKDKGLWTAWLALIGCFVMLFNWIVINFVISGLHSYA
jgi:cytochrome c-type biogenesis protein CcsB